MQERCRRFRFRAILCLVLILGLQTPFLPNAQATPCEIRLPVPDERAQRILATERPFEPANLDFFYSFEHPAWLDAKPIDFVEGPALTEQETKEALREFLERRFPCDPDRVKDGLTVFTDPIARMKAPEPAMRAALASLVGTVGEPAIPYVLARAPVSLMHFGVVLQRGTGLPSRSGIAYDLADGTRQIVLDRRFRFAPFASFAPLLFHEVLHTGVDDDVAGLIEESVASALESLIYMEMLLTDPSLAAIPDERTRLNNNPMAVARLNSGPVGSSDLTLFVPGGTTNINPITVEPLTEFYEYYFVYSAPEGDAEFRERQTEGNILLQDVLARLAEPGATPPADADFDQATAQFVDQNQGVLSAAELIAVACILQLDVPCA
jgi:hypothetical protein